MGLWSRIWRLLSGNGGRQSRSEEAAAKRIRELNLRVGASFEGEKTLSLARQACEEARATLGEAHPLYAQSLNNLANLYLDTEGYARAEPLLHQAIEIFRTSLGETHPHYAQSLNNLATLYQSVGDCTRAETLFCQTLEVRRTALGETHPDFAQSLHNLAVLYHLMKDYARAEPLYRQALEVRRVALGEVHPRYAQSLRNLAALYQSMGDTAQAEALFCRALEVRRATLGKSNPYLAENLNELALLYLAAGDCVKAEPLLRQAADLLRTARDKLDPRYGGEFFKFTSQYLATLDSLAILYWSTGDAARAESLFREFLDIHRTTLSETRPEYTRCLNKLAVLCAASNRPAEAFALLRQAADIDDHLIGQVFSSASDRQRAANLLWPRTHLAVFLSLVASFLTEDAESVRATLKVVLRRKAVRAEADAVRRNAVLGGEAPPPGLPSGRLKRWFGRKTVLSGRYHHLRPQLQELNTLAAQIAQRTLAGPGPEGLQAHRHLLAQLEEQREELERELAKQIPEMNLERQMRAANCAAVMLALPPRSALVEFVWSCPFDFKAVPGRGGQEWQAPRYLAFVVSSGQSGSVRMVDLGEADPIDRLIAAFRGSITGEAELRDLSRATSRLSADADTPGVRLRAAVFDPLADNLGGCQRLFLAPDGDLNRLPFEALPLADGRYLLDAYRMSYLSVGRDILRFQTRIGRQPAEPMVAADPDFDLGMVSPIPSAPAASRLSRDLDRSHLHFGRLPGTRAEGEFVGRRLGVQPLLGGAALEGHLKASRSPRILHLATHGFFLPDQQRDLNRIGRNMELLGVGDAPALGRLSGPGMENPMLRSGLALAGVNTFLRGAALPAEAEDGLLTAEDVAGLDLLDTELVVLSACETGLGAIHVGEGVFGLRRAFIVAGAKTLVLSLWKVPDLITTFLMERFYDNLLTRGLDRDLALSEAQRCTRDATVAQLKAEWLTPAMIERLAAGDANARRYLQQLAQKPDDHRPFADPFFWGAFICQGDPSPLPAGNKPT